MSTPRERLLAEGIKNMLIAIQKSEQIYKVLSKLDKKILRMDEQEIENVANNVAKKVEKYAVNIEKSSSSNSPTPEQIVNKIQEELEKI